MTTPEKVQIVGIGDDGLAGLTAAVREKIEKVELLIGSGRLLSLLPQTSAERLTVEGGLDEIVAKISASPEKKTVVLTSGDPLFYGVARFLFEHLGKDRFEVTPNVSTMQLAFARVMESWDDAYLTNLANQPLARVVERIRIAEKVGLFTTDKNSPSVIAQKLLDLHIDYFHAYVCENLGSPDERVTQGELREVAGQQFAPLNVMVLVRKPDTPDRPVEAAGRRLFGNPDDAFRQSKPKHGLLTPAEVRSVALAELDLGCRSILWDIGAGSGSVAIEASQIASEGAVYAIEMNPEDYQLLTANAEDFGVLNLHAVLGAAPEAWADLPDPDAIFVGGTGRMVTDIVTQSLQRLKPGGRIVVNVGSVENVSSVYDALFQAVGEANAWMFNIARGVYQLERLRFESLNPTFLVAAKKPA